MKKEEAKLTNEEEGKGTLGFEEEPQTHKTFENYQSSPPQSKKFQIPKKVIVGVLVVVILVAAWMLWVWFALGDDASSNSQANEGAVQQITNYEECVSAGYPIMESYPEQCAVPDGQTFIREIESNISSPIEGGQKEAESQYAIIKPTPLTSEINSKQALAYREDLREAQYTDEIAVISEADIDATTLQIVKLTDGVNYYGELSNSAKAGEFLLRRVYFLNIVGQTQLNLEKLEEDELSFSYEQIVAWENLDNDSQVIEAINSYEAQD